MDDLISRQAAIDALRMDIDIIPYAKAREYARAVIETVYNRLEHLPSAQPEQRWIPCSEKMPESDGRYLCDYNGRIHIGVMINKHFRLYGVIVDNLVTAWQPLPAPYKEEKE